jgi:hypothetical protein
MALIPNEIYRGYDAINASLLKAILGHSYFKAKTPLKRTPAMKLGTDIHCAILEPDVWANKYVRMSENINLRTKAGKEERDAIEAEGKFGLKADEYDMIQEIALQTLSYKEVLKYFHEDTETEISMTFEMDEYPGLEMKGQIDLYDPRTKTLVDLKTTADVMKAERQFRDLHYNLQLRFYQRACEANGRPVDEVKVLFVETAAPHTPALFTLSPSLLHMADADIAKALAQYLDDKDLIKPRLIERTIDMPEWLKESQKW